MRYETGVGGLGPPYPLFFPFLSFPFFSSFFSSFLALVGEADGLHSTQIDFYEGPPEETGAAE